MHELIWIWIHETISKNLYMWEMEILSSVVLWCWCYSVAAGWADLLNKFFFNECAPVYVFMRTTKSQHVKITLFFLMLFLLKIGVAIFCEITPLDSKIIRQTANGKVELNKITTGFTSRQHDTEVYVLPSLHTANVLRMPWNCILCRTCFGLVVLFIFFYICMSSFQWVVLLFLCWICDC